jgi:hypothetical protein
VTYVIFTREGQLFYDRYSKINVLLKALGDELGNVPSKNLRINVAGIFIQQLTSFPQNLG